MFPMMVTFFYKKVFMKKMIMFDSRSELNDSHLNNLFEDTFFGSTKMTMMFKHIRIRLHFFEIEYTMEALNNRKPSYDYSRMN